MGLYPRDNPVEIAVAVWPWGAYLGEEALEHGVSCKVSSFRRIGPNTLPPAAKASGQYINSVLAKLEASRARRRRGDPPERGGLRRRRLGRERVRGARRRAAHASRPPSSCLPGITRDTVIRIAHTLGYEVREVNLVRTDLYFADEVFLCGTAAEVTPVASVDGQQIGGRGPITKAVQDTFFAIVSGRDERFARPARVPGPSRGLTRRMVATRSIPLARPHIGERERELVMDVLRSDALACGEMVPAFERAFAERVGTRFAVACSSGTAGLHVALNRLGIAPGRRGDHVELLVHRLGQRDPLRARDAGLRRHRRARR